METYLDKNVEFYHDKDVYKRQPLLMGSDAPQVMNVPGFSIHHEMKSWADAGIPNWDILRAATVNVSIFFNSGNTTVSYTHLDVYKRQLKILHVFNILKLVLSINLTIYIKLVFQRQCHSPVEQASACLTSIKENIN